MDDFQAFGDPARFEISVRWRRDAERRERRPAGYGWSVGDLRLVVGGHNLTRNARGPVGQGYVSWYLLPFFDWLSRHWRRLLHEDTFAWPERSAAPAAVATHRRLETLIDAGDAGGRRLYAEGQAWRQAHAIRAAASGGLLPDLFLRRYLDMIEMSWTASVPAFAPAQFRFSTDPGVAYLPVSDVAAPLWDALMWAVRTGENRVAAESDAAALAEIAGRLRGIESSTVVDFASARIGRDLAEAAKAALDVRGVGALFTDERVAGVPAVARFSAAIAMYGGLAPQLTPRDVEALAGVIAAAFAGPGEHGALTMLVDRHAGPPMRPPFIEGQDLALRALGSPSVLPFVSDFVDVEGLLDGVGVRVASLPLDSGAVRGVALAGKGLTPTVMVNRSSIYNDTSEGVRFTLAHELAHLLCDRSQAVTVGLASGPWAPPGVEKRANAFAAMFLMPRALVLRAFGAERSFRDPEVVAAAAGRLRVSTSALIEHLSNLELVTDYDRDILRQHWRRPAVPVFEPAGAAQR